MDFELYCKLVHPVDRVKPIRAHRATGGILQNQLPLNVPYITAAVEK